MQIGRAGQSKGNGDTTNLNRPADVFVNGTTASCTVFSAGPAQRFMYVGDRSHGTVMVFNRKTLELLDSFGQMGSAPGEFRTLHHMAADCKGNLCVAQIAMLRPETRGIQKFTPVVP